MAEIIDFASRRPIHGPPDLSPEHRAALVAFEVHRAAYQAAFSHLKQIALEKIR